MEELNNTLAAIEPFVIRMAGLLILLEFILWVIVLIVMDHLDRIRRRFKRKAPPHP